MAEAPAPDIIIDPDLQGTPAGTPKSTDLPIAPIAHGGEHPVIDKPDVLIDPDLQGAPAGGRAGEPQQPGFDYKEPGLMSRVWRFITGEGKSDADTPSTFGTVMRTPEGGRAVTHLSPVFSSPGALIADQIAEATGLKSRAEVEKETAYQNLVKLYALNARPDQLHAAALKLPGAEAMPDDAQGNKRVMINGRPTYIAPPGLGTQDVVGGIGEGAVLAAAAMAPGFAIPALMGRGVVPAAMRLAVTPATQVAGTYGTGELIRQAGGGTGASEDQLKMAGVFGLGGEVAGNLARAFVRNWGGTGELYTTLEGLRPTDIVPSDRLTETGRQMIQMAGLDARNITVQDMRNAQTIAGLAARHIVNAPHVPGQTPAAQVVMDAARFRPPGDTGPFPLSVGQASRDPTQLFLEERLLKAGPASAEMRAFQAEQQQARLEAAARLVPGVRRLADLPDEETLGQTIRNSLRAQSDRLTANTRSAYDALDANLTRAGMRSDPNLRTLQFNNTPSGQILTDLHGIVDRGFNADTMPVAQRAIALVGRLISNDAGVVTDSVGNLTARPGAAQSVRGFNLGDLVQTQRALGDMIRDLPATAENASERRILRQLQESVERRAQEGHAGGHTSGDTTLWGDYQNAREAARRELAFTRPHNSDAAHDFMREVNDRRLDLSGQQIADRLFGTNTAIGGSGNTTQILQHLQPGMVPGDYYPVRQLAARRVLFGAKEADADQAMRVASRIREAVGGQPAIMGRVTTPQEALEMQRLAELFRASSPPPSNPPGSGFAAEELARLRSRAIRSPIIGGYLRRQADERLIEQARRAQTGLLNPENFPQVTLPRGIIERTGEGAARILPGAGGLLGTEWRGR